MSDRVPPPRFSFGRVASNTLLVLLGVGVFVAVWFIPFPKSSPRTPTTTIWTPERIKEMKEKTGRAVKALEEDSDNGGAKK